MQVVYNRFKKLLSVILIIAAILCSFPQIIFAEGEEEMIRIELYNNDSIQFESGKVYRINLNDFENFMSQYVSGYAYYYKFILENGKYISGEKMWDEEEYESYIRLDLRNIPQGTYVINENKNPEIISEGRDNKYFVYIKRNKEIENISATTVEELKNYEMSSNKNYRIDKQLLYDLFMSKVECEGKETITSINDITGYKVKYKEEGIVTEDIDNTKVIINLDSIVPISTYKFSDYFGDVTGSYESGVITLEVSPIVECVNFEIKNSSEEDFFNYYFTTNKVYRVSKQQFFDVFIASENCSKVSVSSIDQVTFFAFEFNLQNNLVAKELSEDPGYLYFDFTKTDKFGTYSFEYDGYAGKRSDGDIVGHETGTSSITITMELGRFVGGYLFNGEEFDLNTATPAYLYTGDIMTGDKLYIIQENIWDPDYDIDHVDSNNYLYNYNDIKIVDKYDNTIDLTNTCTTRHYITKESASGNFSSSVIYLGPEYEEYEYLGDMTWAVEGPFIPTVNYVDYVTGELIHTQDITEGETNTSYTNEKYIGWYDSNDCYIDDSTLTRGMTLYGAPKKVKIEIIDFINEEISEDSFIHLDTNNESYDTEDLSSFTYYIERTNTFNTEDYPFMSIRLNNLNNINNTNYIRYNIYDLYSENYVYAVPKNIPINFYDSEGNEAIGDGYLSIYKHKSYYGEEEIDFLEDKNLSPSNILFSYNINEEFKKENPLLVGKYYDKNESNYNKHKDCILDEIESPLILGYSEAKNNKVYIGKKEGIGATCTTGSITEYKVNAVTHPVYIPNTETNLSTTTTINGLVSVENTNLYNQLGGYSYLTAYKAKQYSRITLYFKKINSFEDLKDYNGKYTSALFAYKESYRDLGQGFLFNPKDTSIVVKYNNYLKSSWDNQKTFNTVDDYNNWLETLSYDSDLDSYYMSYTYIDYATNYDTNVLGLFNEDKAEMLNSSSYNSDKLSKYNYTTSNFCIQIEEKVYVPYTKTYDLPALGHTWSEEEWQILSNPVMSDFENAENSSSLDFNSLGTYDTVYKRLCHRANDAYELKVVRHTHTSGEAHKEDEVNPTCTVKGSYKWVVRCTECNEIISSEDREVDALGHTWSDNDWSTVNKDDVTNELYANAYNASSLDINDLDDNDLVKRRLCHRAQDAYELKVEHVHDYGDPKFIWSDDYTSCDAEFKCTINDDTKLIKCTVTPERTEPTYNKDGKIVYTAECTFEGNKYTDKKTVPISKLIDTSAPNVKIIVLNETFNTLMNVLTFGHYTNNSQTVVILAEDADVNSNETPSGVKEIKYYISETGLTNEEVFGLREENWITYSSFIIAPNRECFIYAKAVDNQNNVGYASTDGIVLDNEKPIISGVDNNTDYEDTRIEYTVYDKYLESVKIDGIDVEVNGTTVNSYINNDSSVENNHKPHVIVATDKAGNSITVTFTLSTHVHTPGEAHKENEIFPTCTVKGSYKWVIRCTECNEIISSEDKELDALGHTWSEEEWQILSNPVVSDFENAENSSSLDFDSLGTYDTVYKRLCHRASDAYELKVVSHAHTPGEAHKEDEVNPTCTVKGSYKWVIRCTECNEIISSEDKELDALGHIWHEDWEELTNPSEIDFKEAANSSKLDFSILGVYDTVYKRYCNRAHDAYELKVISHTHTPGEAHKEDEVNPTCTVKGSYKWVVRCTECNEIISSEDKEVDALGHTWSEEEWQILSNPVVSDFENAKNSNELDFNTLGEKDKVYKRLCHRASDAYELKVVSHTHTPGEAHKEDEVNPTCTIKGSYKWVIRCTECNEIISSEVKEVDALGHIWHEDWEEFTNPSEIDFKEANNSSVLDYNSLNEKDTVYKRLCHRASDAYELKVEKAALIGTIGGKIIDKNGNPVKGAKVVIHSVERVTYTDDEGKYIFNDVEAGDHKLWIYVKDIEICEVSLTIAEESISQVDSDNGSYDIYTKAKGTYVPVDAIGIKVPENPLPDKPPVAGDSDNTILYILSIAAILGIIKSKKKVIKVK